MRPLTAACLALLPGLAIAGVWPPQRGRQRDWRPYFPLHSATSATDIGGSTSSGIPWSLGDHRGAPARQAEGHWLEQYRPSLT
jgi:hypothetical protein